MAFKFSLQQILNYREQLEQEAKSNFARVENERQREEANFKALQLALLEQQANLAALNGIDFDKREMIQNYIRGLREDLVKSQKYLQILITKVEEARQILTEKAKDKKILEKLKEKEEKDYVYQEKQNEQKFFDEITTGRASRHSESSPFE